MQEKCKKNAIYFQHSHFQRVNYLTIKQLNAQ